MQTKSKIVDETADFLIVDLWNYLEFYTTSLKTCQNYSKWSYYSTNYDKCIGLCIKNLYSKVLVYVSSILLFKTVKT